MQQAYNMKAYIKTITYLFFILMIQISFAQKAGKKSYKSIKPRFQNQNTKDVEDIFDFKNINRISYYSNSDLLQKINIAEQKKNYPLVYELLKEYVGNFGLKNFFDDRDLYLVWKLAQLAEKLDDAEKAKSLYRLILKHQRTGDIKTVRKYYDSVSVNEKENYLPIEYYYELVEYRKSIDTLLPPVGIQLNMGGAINSPSDDYGPTVDRNNNLLFTSKRNTYKNQNGKNVINEDIFFSKNLGEGNWNDAVALDNINTKANEGSAHISRDGKTMYFARCESSDGYGNCDLYVADLMPDSTWGNIRNLGPKVNSVAWDSHPSLSHSEDTLFFASDRVNGFGMSDIYFTYKTSENTWSAAQNMGPVINTRNNEVSPYMHPVHDVLYFSSSGQLLNFGRFDIYKSYRNAKGHWLDPKNIGPLVNTSGDEYYFTIDYKSKYLFFAQTDSVSRDNLDLYSFPLPMEAQPLATTKFGGVVKDSTGNPYTGIVSIIDLTERIEVAPRALGHDGRFTFELINGHDYLAIITGEDFFRVERQFKLEGDTYVEIITPSLKLKKWAFLTLEFAQASAEILEKSKPDLNKLVIFLVDHPVFKLKISGHTDGQGQQKDNLKLSQRRADSIKDYIIKKGKIIKSQRIEAIGYGSSKPLIDENNDQDRQINRRVEFEIVKMGVGN